MLQEILQEIVREILQEMLWEILQEILQEILWEMLQKILQEILWELLWEILAGHSVGNSAGNLDLVDHMWKLVKNWFQKCIFLGKFCEKFFLAHLESVYSLIWGTHEIWGKGGGDTLALL